ncbi:glycosyl hydrolase family 18 protein [Aliivibrio finisterrensis]|uniref:chitinase n=1 Tax=Aliivibrio finisterrensis TaxID=511998 RepID=A0A6N6RP54_9GAMM|nr:glycosyl hydrolase family 18 protein [Aliivibrio finisterrensis]KAB2823230.1 hypothetical protein F8B77_16450 [Aliivibrio finisterrensis]
MYQLKCVLILFFMLFLTSCSDNNSITAEHSEGQVSGTVAIGAGLSGHQLTLFELDLNNKSQRTVVDTVELDTLSRFGIVIPDELNSEVLLAQIVELEASDTVILEAVIFAQDFDKPIKITPYTDLIAKSILNNDSLSDLDSIKQEYDNVASGVVAMLQPISDSLGISLEADSLLFGHFPIESSGHDELIEAVAFNCDELNCSMDFASNSVEQAVAAQGISTEFTIDDTLAEQLNQTASGLNDLKETPPENFDFTAGIKEAGPVIVLFSYDGAWGQPGDAWAGYNGKIKLINLSDGPLEVANKSLSMISDTLSVEGAWGANLKKKVLKSGKTKYTFKFHKYSQPLQPDEYRIIGFNGKGTPTEVNDLTRCRYKGESCIIKYDDTLSDYVSGSSFVIDINSEEVVEDGDITDDVNASGSSQDRVPSGEDVTRDVVDITLEKAGDPWSTGFNGVIKFSSPVTASSWSLTFQKPADVSAISMWSHGGGLQDVDGQSFISVTNKSWNGSLSPDVENSIGASITGKDSYGEISNDGCVLTLDGVDYTCQVIANEVTTGAEDLSTINNVGTETPEIVEDNGTVDNEEDDAVTDIAVVDNTTTDIHSAVVKGSGLTQSKTPTTMTFTAPSDFKNKVVAGYLSDWSVYGRGFDVERLLTPEGTFPYNKLVFAFLGICGDKGSLAGTIAAECKAQGKKEFEVVFLDPWADFGVSVSPRQSSKPYVDGKSKGVIEQIQYIKNQVPNINISASIGGWTMSEPFHRMASDPENIQTFVNSLKALQTEYGFTGFDIDWEFPGHGGASGKFTQNDGQYFKDLVCAVKSGLGDNVEVSSAVGATTTFIGHIGEHYKTIYDQGCLDYIYMMNYDYFGAWDTKLGHQTSVLPSTSLSGAAPNDNDMRWSVNAAIQAFEQSGFKRDRLLMGIANYGRGFKSNDLTTNQQGAISGTKASKDPSAGTFENGVMEGYDLWLNVAGNDLQGRGDFALYSDFEAHADAYYNNVTGDYISIDTPRTAYVKAKLADILGLAGTFVWTVEQDDGRIVTAMQDGLGINGTVPADRSAAYTTCGIPFKDGDNNLCAQLYNGLNVIASNSGSDKTIAAVIADAVNVPIADPIDISTTDTSTTDTNTDDSGDTYTLYRSELNQHQSDAESGYKTAINDARLMIRTLDNSIVEAVTPLNVSNPDNVKRVESIFTQSDWDELFSHAAPEYSYPKFLQAVAKFPALCDTYTDGRNSDAICRKSLVTMFAHFVQETGKNSAFEGETWKQGLYFVREMGWTETALNGYNGNCNNPDNFASQVWPCGKFDSGEYKSYFGRGAKQLSYNYNYGPFSDAIYGDANVLLNSPEKVADTWLNIASAIFFYVYPQPPKPSMLSVIDGSWTPNQADIDAGISSGFGATIHIINGGLECGAGNESHTGPANRISYYQKFADYFSMAIPADEALDCQDMKPFESTGAGAVPIYWEQDWQNAYKCKLVSYQTAYTTFDDDGYENCVKATYPDVVIVEDVDNSVVNDDSGIISTDDNSVANDDSDTDSTDDNSSAPSNPADCTSGYCTAVASINGKDVSEVITNANASSVTRTNELKFGGYVSDWAQYGREFALADVGATAYTELVYSFFGICGDQGTFVSDKNQPNSTTADKIAANCTALNKQEGEIVSLDFWGSFQNSNRFDPGYTWNENGIYDSLDATNWNELNADNTRGLVGELINLKQQNPSLDISLSIGGWTLSEPFHRVAADTTLTDNFANSVLEIVDKFEVNGEPLFTTIDIDWEFPGHGGDCNASGCYTSDDGTNFVTLLQAVRNVLDSNGYSQVKLSSAVGATEKYINLVGASNYQALGGANGLLDKIFLMSYDYWGSWDTVLGHQTNLFGDSVDPNSVDSDGDQVATNSAENAINLLVNMGVEKSRMMLGIANYSRGKQASAIVTDGDPFSATGVSDAVLFGTWEPTVLEGYDLFANVAGPDVKGVNNFKLFTDADNNTDYYYNPVSGVYHSIDTPRTAALKTKYAANNGLRGVFVWTVEQDYQGLIADTVNYNLGHAIAEDGAYSVAEIESLSSTCGENVNVTECAALNDAAGDMGAVDPNFVPSTGGMNGGTTSISNPADCTSGYCTAVASINGKDVSEVITNANASSVTRTNELKFGGYVSDWAQYGREFALADVGATAYTELVYSFFGICGDQGTFVSDKNQPNSTTADKIAANCTALNKQEGEIVSLDFWGSFQNSNRFDPGYTWNENGIYDSLDATNWNELNADNTRGLVGELINLKQQNPSLDISLSIGGWTLSEPFHRVAADTTLTDNFANSVLEIVDKFEVNGEPLFTTIDIDWEFPGHGGDCNASGCYTSDDGTNFVTLLQAVRNVLDSNGYSQVKLSSAVGATEKYINLVGASNYQALGGANGLLDKIFLMSYDYWGSWDTVLGHQTNLFGDSVDPNSVDSDGDQVATNSAENAINLLVNMGVDKSRMMLGIANYSRGKQASAIVTDGDPFSAAGVSDAVLFGTWEPTVLEGYDLFANVAGPDVKGVNNFKLFTDADNNTDYYYNPVSGVYHSIDTPRTAALKTKYAANNGLRGVFVWTVEQDYQGLIADTVNYNLGHAIAEDGAYSVAEIESLSSTCGENVNVTECAALNDAAGDMGAVDPNFVPPVIPSTGGMNGGTTSMNIYPSNSICYNVTAWSATESWGNYTDGSQRYHNDNLYEINAGQYAYGTNEPGTNTSLSNLAWRLIGSCI